MRLWPSAALAALLVAPLAAPSRGGAAPDASGSFSPTHVGGWCLNPDAVHGLLIHNRRAPNAVRLRLTGGSNGWLWVETSVDRYVLWSVGNFSQQNFAFGDGKVACAPRALAPGAHRFGSWTLTADAGGLTISHDANSHHLRLPAGSQGEIEIQSSGNARTVQPGDAL